MALPLSNEQVFGWYNDGGTLACVNKIFDHFSATARSDSERRSLRSRISYLVSNLKRAKGSSKAEQLKQEFKVPYSLISGSSGQHTGNSRNNNNDPKETSLNKDLRPRRTKQLVDADGNDEDSGDSWDSSAPSSRRRGGAGRVNYNVKDMISANSKQTLVHDADGRLVNFGGLDLCDCLESSCPGCHNPCSRCESFKCGSECRSRRKWLYEQILVEGTELKIKNPASAKGNKNAA